MFTVNAQILKSCHSAKVTLGKRRHFRTSEMLKRFFNRDHTLKINWFVIATFLKHIHVVIFLQMSTSVQLNTMAAASTSASTSREITGARATTAFAWRMMGTIVSVSVYVYLK